MAIKGPDLTLDLISDLSVGAKKSVFKDSLSLLQLVIPQSFSSFLAFSLPSLSLSNSPSFIFFLSLKVSSSWPIPPANPLAPHFFLSSCTSFFSSSLVLKVMAGPDLFLQWLLHMLWSAMVSLLSPFLSSSLLFFSIFTHFSSLNRLAALALMALPPFI